MTWRDVLRACSTASGRGSSSWVPGGSGEAMPGTGIRRPDYKWGDVIELRYSEEPCHRPDAQGSGHDRPVLAESYLFKAPGGSRSCQCCLQRRTYSDVVREAQEVVELALKGMLRQVGVEPPRWHDVNSILPETVDSKRAPVAQLDRAPGFEPVGRGFKSLRARHLPTVKTPARPRGVGLSPTAPTTALAVAADCPGAGRAATRAMITCCAPRGAPDPESARR